LKILWAESNPRTGQACDALRLRTHTVLSGFEARVRSG